MTDDERISELALRVDRLENDLWGELKEIKDLLTRIQVTAAGSHCPAPGRCLVLEPIITAMDLRVQRLEGTHDNLAKTVADLIRWRAWLTGINVVISSISLIALGLIGNYIVKHL